MSTYSYNRRLPVEEGWDILVAGGGPAGTAAAVCAARLGAKVLLVEALGCLGGTATSGLVSSFNPTADGEKMLVGGFMREIVESMYERGFIPSYLNPDQWRRHMQFWTPFQPEGLKLILDELAVKAGVELRFFTRAIDAEVEAAGKRIAGVVIQNIEGLRFVRAKAYIDATGDAYLAALCGAACREAGRDTPAPMPPTLCSLFADIDWARVPMGGINGGINPAAEQEANQKAVADGFFSQPDLHLPGMMRMAGSTGFLNGGHVFGMNALKCASLSAGIMQGRRLAAEYSEFYRKYMPGFENLRHVATAAMMGVRESRRIVGEYELTQADHAARRQFPDQIGVFNNFVDIHPYDTSKEEMKRAEEDIYNKGTWLKPGECYGLPYGILVPRGWSNLWVPGRSNSSDVAVHAAIRVQPAASMMGQAAGTAALQSIRTGQPACDLDTSALVQSLRAAGAYLPQKTLSRAMTRG